MFSHRSESKPSIIGEKRLFSHRSESKPSIAVLGCKGLPFTDGLEIIMEELGQRFVHSGYGFDVFVRRHYMEGKQTPRTHKGIRLRYSRGIHSKHLDAISHTFTALIKLLFSKNEIVYINAIGISVLGFIPKLLGKKIIVHVHGLDFNREKWGSIAKYILKFSCLTTVCGSDHLCQ